MSTPERPHRPLATALAAAGLFAVLTTMTPGSVAAPSDPPGDWLCEITAACPPPSPDV